MPSSIDPDTRVTIDNHSASSVFCCAILGGATTETFYTDTTGSFPVTSLEHMWVYFVVYDYDTNTISAKLCLDFKDDTITTVFEDVFNKLKTKGYTHAFNVTENQATAPIKAFPKTKGWKWQFIERSNNCVNTSDQASQTLKNNFIGGFS